MSRQRRFPEAVTSLAEAIRLQPDLAPAHASLAAALLGAGQLDASIESHRRNARANLAQLLGR